MGIVFIIAFATGTKKSDCRFIIRHKKQRQAYAADFYVRNPYLAAGALGRIPMAFGIGKAAAFASFPMKNAS